jgi:hypothetical protein
MRAWLNRLWLHIVAWLPFWWRRDLGMAPEPPALPLPIPQALPPERFVGTHHEMIVEADGRWRVRPLPRTIKPWPGTIRFRVEDRGYKYAFVRHDVRFDEQYDITEDAHEQWVERMLGWKSGDLVLARRNNFTDKPIFINYGPHTPEAAHALNRLLQELEAMDE